MLLLSFCNRNSDTVTIGMGAQLLVSPDSIIPQQVTIVNFFEQYLKIAKYEHYSGKTVKLFDTVYTSVINHSPISKYDEFLTKGAIFLKEQSEDNLTSLLFRSGDVFIYRTIVPEEKFHQVILVDIAGRDKAKIAGYFEAQKIKSFLRK